MTRRRSLPSITVVVPTYGREQVLLDTLDSILEQEYPSFGVIVVDQTQRHLPETLGRLEALERDGRIQLLHEPVPNLPRARNVGTAHATGEVILFLDDDVLLPEGFIRRYGETFLDLTVAGACGLTIDPGRTAEDAPVLTISESEARNRLDLPLCNFGTYVRNPLHFVGANMAFRRDWIVRAGGFSHRLTGSALGEDVEFAGRLRRLGGQTLYDPALALTHLRAPSGGCRLASLAAFSRSRDRMRNYYYALLHGAGPLHGSRAILRRWDGILRRLLRLQPQPVAAKGTLPAPTPAATGGGGRIASGFGRVTGALQGIALALKDLPKGGDYFAVANRRVPETVSIVIATLGREEHLVDTLESLRQFEAAVLEVIVVDQTPRHDPRTERYLRNAALDGRLRWVREKVRGASRARNIGIAAATGEIILFLDDDITACRNLVQHHLRHYSDPGVWAVGGRIAWREDDVDAEFPFPGNARAAAHAMEAPVCYHTTPFPDALHLITCNLSVRRDVLMHLNGFNERFTGGGEDLELVGRLQRAGGRAAYDPRAVVIHHSAPAGGTRQAMPNPISFGFRRGLAGHYAALRAVGILRSLTAAGRRSAGQFVRFARRLGLLPAPLDPIPQPPRRGHVERLLSRRGGIARALLRKGLEFAGSAAAIPVAFFRAIEDLRLDGHYLRTARQFRRRLRRPRP